MRVVLPEDVGTLPVYFFAVLCSFPSAFRWVHKLVFVDFLPGDAGTLPVYFFSALHSFPSAFRQGVHTGFRDFSLNTTALDPLLLRVATMLNREYNYFLSFMFTA